MVFHDFQDPRSAKAPKRLSIWVLFATLRYVESVANRMLRSSGKGRKVCPGASIRTTGLMLGDAIISILCLNKHKGNRLILTEIDSERSAKLQEMRRQVEIIVVFFVQERFR
jgi:hypothetical protein